MEFGESAGIDVVEVEVVELGLSAEIEVVVVVVPVGLSLSPSSSSPPQMAPEVERATIRISRASMNRSRIGEL